MLALACARKEPPGAERIAVERVVGSTEPDPAAKRPATRTRGLLGTVGDNLPFAPDGTRIGSIAWRTWVYTDVGPKRGRYGYLRAGAVVDARGPEIVNERCPGGWYRINPRGFVCQGVGATLDLNHPVVVAGSVRPVRGEGLPYVYARAKHGAPFLYFRLPSREEMEAREGPGLWARVAAFRERIQSEGLEALIGPIGPPPPFLSTLEKLEKPYGTKRGVEQVESGERATPETTGFALAQVFEWEGRIFGLTTELEILGLERLEIVRPSTLRGVQLPEDWGLPVAFTITRTAVRHSPDPHGNLVPNGLFDYRTPLRLTGKTAPGNLLEIDGGDYVLERAVRRVEPRTDWPLEARTGRKWIDVSITSQTLVAYEGRRPVYATLVSTGAGGLADPEKSHATVRGAFRIYQKDVSSTMDGEGDNPADSYALRDVPFVQYFHKGYALHGTYWHDGFGAPRSHGCVNLAPVDAAWLFEWTDPVVPPDWHGAVSDGGTAVYVRP